MFARATPLLLLATLTACRASSPFDAAFGDADVAVDLFVRGARIVDGTGSPVTEGDVLARDGRIVFVGEADAGRVRAARSIDARGRVLAPGFIDLHAHGDPLTDDFETALAMGVTTVVLGQDGRSAGASWARRREFADSGLGGWLDELEARGTRVNVAALSGHGTLREIARVGPRPAPLRAEDVDAMRAALVVDLDAGAFGLSTGLEYVPGRYADEAELVALAQEVARSGGVVMSHLRTEDDVGIEEAIDELAAQGRAGARVHVSHLKVVLGKGAERGREVLTHIEAHRAAGVEMTADIYPYLAGYTGIAILFPEWALPPADYSEVVHDKRGALAAHLARRLRERNGPEALLLGTEPYAGLTLAEAAEEERMSPVRLLIELGPGGASGAHFTQDRATHDVLVASHLTAIATDGGPGVPHPRSTGTFARLFQRYVAGEGQLTLEEAVRQSTSYPASILGRDDLGVIAIGARADLVLFDPERVAERSDYLRPELFAEGFDVVVLGGHVAREDGTLADGRHGVVLRRGIVAP